ncbi:MAG: S-adenosylmethionine decarboxylase [Candidatus Omnitrophica bacterium]|nr:S-adenosylmethionine decarboxylase [Candidatus Omnitrophota bacterium]MCF7894251.1 S-adenosylmethionine decarboxylase [Candidatus Omnitrophota bacterium]
MKKTYGYELIINLNGCNLDILSSKKKLQCYVDQLCELINMKKFGKTILKYFGKNKDFTKGYSLVQLIETSSITGHFSDKWLTAYINIFSCQPYDHKKARKFTKQFFQAKKISSQLIIR